MIKLWTFVVLGCLATCFVYADEKQELSSETQGQVSVSQEDLSKAPAEASSLLDTLEEASESSRLESTLTAIPVSDREMFSVMEGEQSSATRLLAVFLRLALSSEGDVSNETVRALRELTEVASEKERSMALCLLGNLYRDGVGVVRSRDEAIRLYGASAALGNRVALNNLGCALIEEFEDKNRAEEARAYLMKAADMGSVAAQFNVGALYLRGDFGEIDEDVALEWFQKAADKGHRGALACLGLGYLWGRGVEEDDAKGLAYLRTAAELGYFIAIEELAMMYSHGWVVEEDDEVAKEWFNKLQETDNTAFNHNVYVFHLQAHFSNG